MRLQWTRETGPAHYPRQTPLAPPILTSLRLRLETGLSFIYPAPWWISTVRLFVFKRSARGTLPSPLPIQSQSNRRNLPITDHHGIVVFSQRVKVPVGPSAPSSATRTTSREPSSTDSVPSYPLRFVLVKPGETRLTLIPVASSSTIIPNVIALRAALDAGYTGPKSPW